MNENQETKSTAADARHSSPTPGSTGPYLSAVVVTSPAGTGKVGHAEYLRGVFRKMRVIYDPAPGTKVDISDLVLCNPGQEDRLELPEGTLKVTMQAALRFL